MLQKPLVVLAMAAGLLAIGAFEQPAEARRAATFSHSPRMNFISRPSFSTRTFSRPSFSTRTFSRPAISHRFVNRPFVNRPYINRPYINRPYINRPFVHKNVFVQRRFRHPHRSARVFYGVPYGLYAYDSYYSTDNCSWLYWKARSTGSSYWWDRYYACRYDYDY